jgi:hypothetical protein
MSPASHLLQQLRTLALYRDSSSCQLASNSGFPEVPSREILETAAGVIRYQFIKPPHHRKAKMEGKGPQRKQVFCNIKGSGGDHAFASSERLPVQGPMPKIVRFREVMLFIMEFSSRTEWIKEYVCSGDSIPQNSMSLDQDNGSTS